MRLILTAGMPGAGKEEFLTAASDSGIPFLRMGDIVREFHFKRDEKDQDLTVGQFANIERERHGFDIWAKRAVEKMYGDIFMVDGCRSRDEVRAYLGITPDVTVIGIFASPTTRYDRLVKRGRDDAPKNMQEFEERDKREMNWGLAETIALADMMVINESSLDDFRKEVQRLMKVIRR
ncbi:MAG: AAA family ATPase [Candidatus Methanomethylophilaceae archaeon]|nr:AAA family ATPase [Candidatus Methanomethylophilaceae archaeon]